MPVDTRRMSRAEDARAGQVWTEEPTPKPAGVTRVVQTCVTFCGLSGRTAIGSAR